MGAILRRWGGYSRCIRLVEFCSCSADLIKNGIRGGCELRSKRAMHFRTPPVRESRQRSSWVPHESDYRCVAHGVCSTLGRKP